MPPDYLTYLGLAILLVIAPGPDFAVVTKNSLMYGRAGGLMTSVGVVASLLIQGSLAAFGIAALLVRSVAAFNILKIVGTLYLVFLGVQALRAALSRHRDGGGQAEEESVTDEGRRRTLLRGLRQGFLSNITNPKVLVFYFSLLPQFADPVKPALSQVLVLAATHAVLALIWLIIVVVVLDSLHAVLQRPRPRKVLEGLTGVALLGFAVQLITASQG